MDLSVDVEVLRRTLRRHGVWAAWVFGSRARGDHGPTSDIDVGVLGVDDVAALVGEVPAAVDAVNLETAPLLLAGRAVNDGELLLDDDPPRRVAWEADVRKRHADERFRRAQFRRDFAAGARAAARG